MNKKYTVFFLVLATAFLSGCLDSSSGSGSTSTHLPTEPEEALKFTEEDVIEKAKEVTAKRLIDPSSAIFRDLYVIHIPADEDGSQSGGNKNQFYHGFDPDAASYYVCGEVNGKNRFGGYAGFTGFHAFIYYDSQEEKLEGAAVTEGSFLYDIGYERCRYAL